MTQVPVVRDNPSETSEIAPLDFDQMLFFKVKSRNIFHHIFTYTKCISKKKQEDFEDDIKTAPMDNTAEMPAQKINEESSNSKPELGESTTKGNKAIVSDSTILDLLDISTDEPTESDCLLDIFSNVANGCKPTASSSSAFQSSSTASTASSSSSSNLLTFDFLKKMQGSTTSSTDVGKKGVNNKTKINDKKATAWMDLFADLDPLANPTTMEKKIAGLNQNWLDA